jgi:hypothetical protein
VGEHSTRLPEHRLGVGTPADQPRESHGLVVARSLIPLHRVAVSADLRVHGLTQPEPLVPELWHELRLEVTSGSVDVANRFEQAEW